MKEKTKPSFPLALISADGKHSIEGEDHDKWNGKN